MFFLIVFLLLIVDMLEARHAIFQIGIDATVSNENRLVECVSAISRRNFDQLQNIEVIIKGYRNSIIPRSGDFATVLRNVVEFEHQDFRQVPTKYAIIYLGCMNLDEDFEILSSLEDFHPQGRFIISINNEIDPLNLGEYLQKIIDYLAVIERWNVVILMNNIRNEKIRVNTYTSYSTGNCRRSPVLVDQGTCDIPAALTNLFPVFTNTHNCPMRLVTLNFPPFSYVHSENGQKYYKGSESNVVPLIVQKFNATYQLIEEHTGLGIREQIQNKTADLGWAGLLQYHIPGTTFTQSYLSVGAFVIIPLDRVLSSWKHLTIPFQNEVWMTLGALLSVFLVIKLLVPFIRREFPVEFLLRGFSGTGISKLPKKLYQRLYYLSWIITGYVMMQVYLANLTGILTSPAQPEQIQTLLALENSRINLIGTEVMRNLFKETYPRIFRNWKVVSDEDYIKNKNTLESWAGQYGMGTYASRTQIRDIHTRGKPYFYVIPEPLRVFPLAILMANSSVFLEGSNRVIGRASAAGLFRIWEERFDSEEDSKNPARADDVDSDRLDFAALKKIFLVLCIGHSISSVVFGIEIIFARFQDYHSTCCARVHKIEVKKLHVKHTKQL